MKKSIVGLLVIVFLVVCVFLYVKKVSTPNVTQKETKSFFSLTDKAPVESKANPLSGEDMALYTDPTYHFTFSHPASFKTSSFEDGGGYTILVQDTSNHAIQIYITPFDEDIILTPERIKKDIPDIVMNNTKTVQVGGVQAQTFTSTNELFGTTREVWLVHQGSLYQIVTTPDVEMTLAGILLSWVFN